MLDKISKYTAKYKMFDGCRGIVVGFSGGADSVCLLTVLKMLSQEQNIVLKAVHVNHGIRGQEAKEDEEFCVAFCKNNDIALEIVSCDVPKIARERKQSLEEAGRNIRYESFDSAADELAVKLGVDKACVRIAVAHHMNDNAETVLFHMVRGTKVAGMCGIMPIAGRLIRPLLCVARNEIEAFLLERHSEYCIDSTNESNEYARNIIRNNVISDLKRVNSRTVEHICDFANDMIEIKAFLDREVEKLIDKCVVTHEDGVNINVKKLMEADKLLRSELVYNVIASVAGRKKDIERSHIEYVLEMCEKDSGKYIELPYGIICSREYENIRITNQKAVSGPNYSFEIQHINIEDANIKEKNSCIRLIDCDKINDGLLMRTCREGDYITIDKAGNTKSLNRYFIDEKVPRSRREQIQIIFDGDEAVWIVGMRDNPRYFIDDKTINVAKLVLIKMET